jgi:hypothetical protein
MHFLGVWNYYHQSSYFSKPFLYMNESTKSFFFKCVGELSRMKVYYEKSPHYTYVTFLAFFL